MRSGAGLKFQGPMPKFRVFSWHVMDRARASTYANAFSSCTAAVQRHGGGQCTSSEGNQTMAATACSTHRARDSRQYLRPLRQSLAGEARLVRRRRPRAWCRAARSWAAHRTCRPYIVMAHTVMAYVGGEILGGASCLWAPCACKSFFFSKIRGRREHTVRSREDRSHVF